MWSGSKTRSKNQANRVSAKIVRSWRILVIGAGGAGKSTLSRHLNRLLGIPLIHLDRFYWRAGWRPADLDAWQATVDTLTARHRWIMDGNFGGTLESRLRACDSVVFLDLPRVICLGRILRRWFSGFVRVPGDTPRGCRPRLNWSFARWVWRYPEATRPSVMRLLKRQGTEKTIIILRSPREVVRFIRSLSRAAA